jgi:hypothetical protein
MEGFRRIIDLSQLDLQGIVELKKIIAGILIFVFTVLFSFLIHFPTESLVQYELWQLEKKTGISINYETGIFHLASAETKNVEILKQGKKIFDLDELRFRLGLSNLNLECKKGGGVLKADLSSGRTVINLDHFKAVTDSKKFFKEVTLTGSFLYRNKQKEGTGKLQASLKDPLDPMITSDLQLDSDARVNAREINVDIVRIVGNNITGSGVILININSGDFGNSPISGNLNITTGGTPVKLKLSGTINNPSALPSIGINQPKGDRGVGL